MEKILRQYSPEQIDIAAKVKAVIFDIDGVMTDGGIIYDNQGNELKKFNVKDGMIVKHLRQAGIIVGALTGRDSPVVRKRCEELQLDFHYHGVNDKWKKCHEALVPYALLPSNIAYLGDDLIDLALIQGSALGVVPADAPLYIREKAVLVSAMGGGNGVLREVGDMVLAAKGHMESIVNTYLEKGKKL